MKTKHSSLLVLTSLGITLGTMSLLANARPASHPGGHAAQLQALDLNADGEISTGEIESATTNQALAIDTDGDGLISSAEILAMQERKRQERIASRLAKADSNGDGNVSLAEFAEHRTAMALRLDRDGDGVIRADEMPQRRHGQRHATARPDKP